LHGFRRGLTTPSLGTAELDEAERELARVRSKWGEAA
jgi:hypothetical protein